MVELAAAHRPVEEVLEAAGQRSRVLRGAEQHRIRLGDLPAQSRRGRRQQVAVMIGVERRQLGQAVIQDRRTWLGAIAAAVASAAVLVEPLLVLPDTSKIRACPLTTLLLRPTR